MDHLDANRATLQDEAAADRFQLTNITTFAVALTVGHIIWIIRSGVLLSSIMAVLPSWRYLDPIPVLSERPDNDEDPGDGETLDSMVEQRDSQ